MKEANDKDAMTDDDGDGVADVKQISGHVSCSNDQYFVTDFCYVVWIDINFVRVVNTI